MTRKTPAARPPAPAPAGASAASAAGGARRRKHPAGPGRPRLSESERRTVTVALTLTPAERDEAERRAAATGLRLAPYLREAALGGPPGGDPAALASSHGPAQVERLALLREAVRQLAKAGSNVNQIAHAANSALLAGEPVAPQIAAAEAALADLRAALADLRQWPGIKTSIPAERGAPRAAALEPGAARRRRS